MGLEIIVMIKITTNLPEGVLASTDSFYIEEQKGYYKYCIYSHNGWVVDTARDFGEAKKMMETLQFAEDIRDEVEIALEERGRY
jgi:hypothetical protein|tara:strand:- start:373 stop:624 length:252 start_codon:yes stop_codon:yes gene_type:complete